MKAHLITSPENLRYIANFTGEGAVLITSSGKILFTDGRFTIQAQNECPDFEIIVTNDYVSEIKKLHIFKLFVEKNKMTVSEYTRLKKHLPFTYFANLSPQLKDMRTIKTDDEIEKIAHSAEIANSGFEHIKSFIKAGMSEREVALELELYVRKHGAEALSFDIIVASAERAAMAHASITDSLIPNNTYVLLDFGVKYKGYCSDMTRMIKIGKPPEELQKIYEIVKDAQSAALSIVKAGVSTKDVDEAAREVIKNAGYGEQFVHSTGHGVGLNIHEEPRISSKSDAVLEAGMVITIEPGIYIEGIGGVRIEDMILVTKDGYRNFSVQDK